MKKKLLFVLAAVIAVTMMLSACGGGSTTTTPPAGGGGSPAAPGGSPTTPTPPAATPEVTLILTNHDADETLSGQWCHKWADMVSQKSNGRIEVQVNNGGSLAGPTQSLDKVKDGTVDLAFGLQQFYPGQFPMTDGLSLPYLPYTSASQASDIMMNIWMNTTLLQSDTGYQGTKVILIRSNCDAPITTASKKLNTVNDLQGMTIRASTESITNWLKAFGATGKGCPINELFQNLQNGAFDGAITDWHGIYSYKLYDNCAKYFADEAVVYSPYYFLMNQAKYDSLSAENKAVIDECSGQAALDLMNGDWDTMKATTTDAITKAGGEVYKLPDSEHAKLVAAADKVTSDWIAANGDNGKQLHDKIVALCQTTAGATPSN
ncbi:MAG: TRAP transporter substrate-binding protein DctP [Clostridiales bacterium]|nr:TRAP transporter substrate-binding protein DctP [Clostridiales bacterium]